MGDTEQQNGETERFLTSQLNSREEEFEASLRPDKFDDFPGQPRVKEQLQIVVQAAKERDEAIGHILLSGPPGLGKTTLAHIIATTRDKNITATSAPVIEKPGDLAGMLTSLNEGDILFIDEIHRLPTVIEEYLYNAMEDFVIDIVVDQGPGARSVRLSLPHFTLIGATTRQGNISAPLRSRFTLGCRLDYYGTEDLQTILERSAKLLQIQYEKDGLYEIAKRSRGTPRIANNLLRWVRDYAQVKRQGPVKQASSGEALEMLNIDAEGLDEMDNRILQTIVAHYNGGPVGLKTLAVAVGEAVQTIEDVYEPFLIQEGFLKRTLQGRMATEKAGKRFGINWNTGGNEDNEKQPDLF